MANRFHSTFARAVRLGFRQADIPEGMRMWLVVHVVGGGCGFRNGMTSIPR